MQQGLKGLKGLKDNKDNKDNKGFKALQEQLALLGQPGVLELEGAFLQAPSFLYLNS